MSARLRGQRISRAELIAESREVLNGAGVRNHSRARLLSLASSEVIASGDPLFSQLQPHVAKRDSAAWLRAFALVTQFLAERGLKVTLGTTEVENREPPGAIGDSSSSAEVQLTGLLEAAPPKRSIQEKMAGTDRKPPTAAAPAAAAAAAAAATPSPSAEKEEPPKRKAAATRKGAAAAKGKPRAAGASTPQKESKGNVVFISSPGKHLDIPSDSELQSDFVIEEIRPREKK
jgi:hypothetical protein